MRDFISMLNPYSFYYLWQNVEGRKFINRLINNYINNKEEYRLLDFFNKSFNNVRSYPIFESNNSIVLIDFDLNNRVLDDDRAVITVLEGTTKKNIYFILFHNKKGKDSILDNTINIYINKSFLYADSYYKQKKTNKVLTNYLYKMPCYIYKLYLHEAELIDNKRILC